jgi:hypothetical protein
MQIEVRLHSKLFFFITNISFEANFSSKNFFMLGIVRNVDRNCTGTVWDILKNLPMLYSTSSSEPEPWKLAK